MLNPQDKDSDKNKTLQQNSDDKQEQADKKSEQSKSDEQHSKDNWEKTFAEENRQERAKQAAQIRKKLENIKNQELKARAEANKVSYGAVGKSKAVMDWRQVLKKSVEDEQDRWSYRRSNASNNYMARVEELEDENKAETDGYSYSLPREDLRKVNVMWLVYNNNDFHPTCGKVIYVDSVGRTRQNFTQLKNYKTAER